MTSNPVADPTTRLLPFAATAVTAFAASASADKGWIIIWKENDAIDRASWNCLKNRHIKSIKMKNGVAMS